MCEAVTVEEVPDYCRRWQQTWRMGRRRFVWMGGVFGSLVISGLLLRMLDGPLSSYWAIIIPLALIGLPLGGYLRKFGVAGFRGKVS
jgi:hypothetical protein